VSAGTGDAVIEWADYSERLRMQPCKLHCWFESGRSHRSNPEAPEAVNKADVYELDHTEKADQSTPPSALAVLWQKI